MSGELVGLVGDGENGGQQIDSFGCLATNFSLLSEEVQDEPTFYLRDVFSRLKALPTSEYRVFVVGRILEFSWRPGRSDDMIQHQTLQRTSYQLHRCLEF